MDVAVGSFLVSTDPVGTQQAISGLGFSPTVVVFCSSEQSTDADGRTADILFSFGFHANAKNRCISAQNNDNTADDQDHRISSGTVIKHILNGGTVDGAIKVASLDGDGFTVEVTNQYGTDRAVEYIALGGSDIVNADIQNVTLPAATGNNDQTPFAFDPDFLLLIGAGDLTTEGQSTKFKVSIGATDGTSQYVLSSHSDDGSANTSLCGTYGYDGEMYAIAERAGGVDGRASFVQWLTGGWRWNILEVGGAQSKIYVLGLETGGAIKLGDILSQTDTVTEITETGVGFQPAGLALFSHCRAKSAQNVSDNNDARASVGFVTGAANRRCVGYTNDDNANPPRCSDFYQKDGIYFRNGDIASGLVGAMDLVSLDADGFTAIMDDADPNQAFIWYIAFKSTNPDTRDRLLKYHENPYVSRRLGRTVVIDTGGWEVPAYRIEFNQWIRSNAGMPTTRKYASLVEDPAADFIEAVQTDDAGKASIQTARETMLDSVLRRLNRTA